MENSVPHRAGFLNSCVLNPMVFPATKGGRHRWRRYWRKPWCNARRGGGRPD
jgi:hypothetical protein